MDYQVFGVSVQDALVFWAGLTTICAWGAALIRDNGKLRGIMKAVNWVAGNVGRAKNDPGAQ